MQQLSGAAVRREGADPCRRPRQGPLQGEGGRADKGGVRIAKSREEVQGIAEQMLGNTLVTMQTGPDGPRRQPRARVGGAATSTRELYLSALVDRGTSRVAFIVSAEGGMDIEKVARDDAGEDPHRHRSIRRPAMQPFHGRKIAFALGPQGRAGQAVRQARRRPLPAGRREGHEPARDQSAGRHQGRRADRASTPR